MQAVENTSRPERPYSFDGSLGSDDPKFDLPPELLLLLAMARSHSSQSAVAKQNVDQAFDRLSDLRDQIEEAIERAREAEDGAGFWNDVSGVFGGDIATIAGIIAAAAVALGTGGAGAVVLASIAVTCMATAKAGEKLGWDPKICMALQVVGALAGLASGRVDNLSGLLETVRTGASLTQSGATAVGGTSKVVAGQYEGQAIEERAQAGYHEGERDLALDSIDDFIAVLEDISKSGRFAAQNTAQIQSDKAAMNEAIIARIGA
jgi:hypothetical protein